MVWSRRRMLAGSGALAGILAWEAFVGKSAVRSEPVKSSSPAGRIPFGAAVRPLPLAEEAEYREALRQYCQQLTPEGSLFWEYLRPSRQEYRFDQADAVLDFADAN